MYIADSIGIDSALSWLLICCGGKKRNLVGGEMDGKVTADFGTLRKYG